MPQTVGPDGAYYDSVPLFAGKRVYRPNGKEGDANRAVIDALKAANALLAKASSSTPIRIPGARKRR